jgi:predicted CXXCH cytochrome family protein
MTKLERFLFSLMVAILAAGVTMMIVKASPETTAVVESSQNCGNCHAETQEAWHSGPHGNASQDSLFTQAWSEQGQPGACLVCHVTGYDPATGTWKQDGVSCEACHGASNSNHPAEPMPVQDPAELCGQCHSDARFGWQEWQSSTHYQRNMTCTICHDPHTAALKVIEGQVEGDQSALCVNCHQQYSMNFSYSVHKQAGANCVDCHLRHYGQADRDVHTMPDHSFNANLDSCNECHAEQMHTAADSNSPLVTIAPDESAPPDAGEVSDQPTPLSPYGYAGLAGLLGLAGGMVLSPWLDKTYHHLTRIGRKK